MSNHDTRLARLTVGVIAAYVENNDVRIDDIPGLIQSVHGALGSVDAPSEPAATAVKTTAAQVRRSITPDALISFEDGKPYKQLKRHLTALGMTPDSYRAKWGLPSDYPMVAASYSARRSAMAKSLGLGRKAPTAPEPKPTPEAPAKARIKGRLGLFGRRSETN